VNSSQRNNASIWLRKVAASMHFGIDTYASSVELLDRFLSTLKVKSFWFFSSKKTFCFANKIGSTEVFGMFGRWLFVYRCKMQRRRRSNSDNTGICDRL